MRLNSINRFLFCLFSITIYCSTGLAQQKGLEKKTGTVTFMTPLNIYVKFKDTRGINQGDTLYAYLHGIAKPVLAAKYMSSVSCAGPIIGKSFLKVGDHVFALVAPQTEKPTKTQLAGEEVDTSLASQAKEVKQIVATASNSPTKVNPKVYGGFTVNSYSNFSNFTNASDIQRWNYSLNLNADNIGGSKFYFSNYMYLSYLGTQWKQVAISPMSNLRVYDLTLSYRTRDINVWVGRHVNDDISGVGPIDGIQAEERFGSLVTGEVIGTRPDFYTLGFNPNLFQFGGYVSQTVSMSSGTMRNTIGAFQQYNNMNTDRRFIYFQHNSTLFKSLSFYASGQLDIFKLSTGKPTNDLSLTSFYFSSVYYPLSRLSVNLTYSAQRNIIYYQTFGTALDSLLESQNQLRNDARIEANIRPFPFTFITLGTGYSFQQGDVSPTRDANVSLTQSNIPVLLMTAGVSYSRILSDYLDGSVIDVNLSKYIPFNSTDITLMLSRLDYRFGSGSMRLIQNQPSFQLTTKLLGNLFLNLFYQGTYSGRTSYGTFMGGITERF